MVGGGRMWVDIRIKKMSSQGIKRTTPPYHHHRELEEEQQIGILDHILSTAGLTQESRTLTQIATIMTIFLVGETMLHQEAVRL